jgi:hypothetical protein
MMKRFLHFSFWIPACAFLLHQLLQKGLNFSLPLIDFYLDPFCFGALVPPLLLLERQWLFKQAHFSKLEFGILLIMLVIFSEVVLPFISPNFVGDPIDAVLIVLGGGWFWWLGRKWLTV